MTTARVGDIAWGDDGVRQTLDAMAQLVEDAQRVPIVVETARAIVANASTPQARALAIRSWLSQRWRFVDDPIDAELLVEPALTLANYQRDGYLIGDCDEVATTGAALGASVGLTPTFTVLGFIDETGTDRLCHVFASLLTDEGRAPIDLDITRPATMVPAPTRTQTYRLG